MKILWGYGLGPNLQRLLQRYFDKQKVVPKAGKFSEHPFSTGRLVTQGDLVSPMIFNILVGAVVRATLLDVFGPQEAQHGFGWAAVEHNICFYRDDGRIDRRNTIWVQTSLTAMVRMFERRGLQTNLSNTKAMVCIPRFIWGKQGVESYKRRATGEGPTFQESKRTRVSCEECGRGVAAFPLRHHMERSHGIVLPQVRGVDVG